MSGIDGAIQIHDSGTTTLVISNEEINDIIKVIQALDDENIFLFKGITETVKNNIKEHNGSGIGMLLGSLGAILLGN